MSKRKKYTKTVRNLIDRFNVVEADIRQTILDIAAGTPNASESRERKVAFEQRKSKPVLRNHASREGLERQIGGNETLSTEWLEQGLLAKRSVGRVETPLGDGTGFLVAPGILLTNQHVLENDAIAYDSFVVFGDEDGRVLPNPVRRNCLCRPDIFFATDENLDFCFVAIEPEDGEPSTEVYGFLPLIGGEGKIQRGDRLAAIHHPRGNRRSISLHRSYLVAIQSGGVYDPYFWHTCDTEEGSSGAPVFSLEWEVVGLHRRAVPDDDPVVEALKGELPLSGARWVFNEGTRTSRIVNRFVEMELSDEMALKRTEMLALWGHRRAASNGMKAAWAGWQSDQHFA